MRDFHRPQNKQLKICLWRQLFSGLEQRPDDSIEFKPSRTRTKKKSLVWPLPTKMETKNLTRQNVYVPPVSIFLLHFSFCLARTRSHSLFFPFPLIHRMNLLASAITSRGYTKTLRFTFSLIKTHMNISLRVGSLEKSAREKTATTKSVRTPRLVLREHRS